MWKKRLFYCVLVLGLLRLGWSLYSTMMYPVFSQKKIQAPAYSLSSEQYEQEFKKALKQDIDNINDDTCVNGSELDRYIGLLLREKEKRDPTFLERNKSAIEALREAVIRYVRVYTTLLNEKMSDVSPKANKREIQNCMNTSGYNVKPLLDALMNSKENGD